MSNVVDVSRAMDRALANHARSLQEALPYAGDVVLFACAEPVPGEVHRVSAADWQGLMSGKLTVHVVPGHHFSVMRTPHVGSLAERLSASIDEALDPDNGPLQEMWKHQLA